MEATQEQMKKKNKTIKKEKKDIVKSLAGRTNIKSIVRFLDVFHVGDRTSIAYVLGIPYGTVTSIISGLIDLGAVQDTGRNITYDRAKFVAGPGLCDGWRPNYALDKNGAPLKDGPIKSSLVVTTTKWNSIVKDLFSM